MIISASYRTDIPAFYPDWFINRLVAGWCCVTNPYGGPPGRVDLTPDAVDAFVFWTRNLEPFTAALEAVTALGLPFVVQYGLTGFPRALERSTIPPAQAIAQMRRVRERWGPDAVVWRYDPLVITSLTPPAWHKANFAALARALTGVSHEVVTSVMHPYRKTTRSLDAAALAHSFTWRDPPLDEKRALLADLAVIAADHGMALALCAQPGLTDIPGLRPAACIDINRLSTLAGRAIIRRRKGNRAGCLCAESRDIGAYNTCLHGCAYCYAVSGRLVAEHRRLRHDSNGAFLLTPNKTSSAQGTKNPECIIQHQPKNTIDSKC